MLVYLISIGIFLPLCLLPLREFFLTRNPDTVSFWDVVPLFTLVIVSNIVVFIVQSRRLEALGYTWSGWTKKFITSSPIAQYQMLKELFKRP